MKFKLKKGIALILAVLMLFSMAACNQKEMPEVSSGAEVSSEAEKTEVQSTSNTSNKQNNNVTVSNKNTGCAHNFKGATCTEASVCTICGKVNGSALGHKFSDATCTEPKKCSVCGKTEGSALGHNMQNGVCTRCGATDGKAQQVSFAKTAYNNLNEATAACNELMDMIYNAWYFAIYKAGDYSDDSECWGYFAVYSDLEDTDLALDITFEAFDVYGVDNYIDAVSDFDIALYIVEEYQKRTNAYDKATNLVNGAKEALKNVTSDREELTGYTTLKNYYTEVSTYLEFIKNVTGSLKKLQTRIENFENITAKYKNELTIKLT